MKNLTYNISSAMLIAGCVAMSVPASAANSDNNISRVSASDTTANLKEVIVNADRINRNVKSIAATHIVGNVDLQRKGITDIGDALRRLPGVNLRDHGGIGSLKTISVRGLGTQHTGVSYDGAPLSDIQSGQIDLSRYSVDNVERIRLMVGDDENIFVPARTAASASSLLISSWTPDLYTDKPLTMAAQLRGGSFGYISPYLKLGWISSEKFGILFSGDYTHSDNNYPYIIPNGIDPIHDKRKNASVDAGHAELNLAWKPNAASSLTAKVYYFDTFQHLPGPAILYSNDSHERLRDRNIFGQMQYQTRLSRIFNFKILGKFNYSRTRYSDVNGKYPGGILDNRYLQREAYGSAAILALPLTGLRLSYALDYFYNDLRSNLKEHNNPHRNSVLQCLSGSYTYGMLTVTARALLSIYSDSPGNGDDSRTFTRLSPSAGISLKPFVNTNFFIRLNYKNIFRMPSFNELYFDHFGSISLKPEVTDQFNLGFTYSLTTSGVLKRLEATLDGYFNIVRDKIVAIPYNMFIWTMSNMGKVHSLGVDATIDATFAITDRHDIVASGSYSYQHAVARTSRERLDWNKQLPYIPVSSGSFSLSWENPWVSAGIHGTGCSARYSTANNYPDSRMPGYMEFGFMIYHTFRFHSHELELRADLMNAFDKRYEIVTRYPMPGRSWQASVKFTF